MQPEAERTNTNEAPWPQELEDLISKIKYKHGWCFYLRDMDRGQGSKGLTLEIVPATVNSYEPTVCEYCNSGVTNYRVCHFFPVPPAAYDRDTWKRWLFDQVQLVESHEAAEFFRFEWDSPNRIGIDILGMHHHVERPYAPHHYPGANPYTIHEMGTYEQADTNFKGQRVH